MIFAIKNKLALVTVGASELGVHYIKELLQNEANVIISTLFYQFFLFVGTFIII